MKLLIGTAEKRLRLYIPYMSLTPEMRKLLISSARRNVKVEIITNSELTNDVEYSYFAGLCHYLPLIDAGASIYEWQGHRELELAESEGCQVKTWPGRTLHSKIALIDNEVVLLGSYNFNARSEHFNSEMIVLAEDPLLNGKLQRIFDRDIYVDWSKSWKCGDSSRRPIPIARRINRFRADILVRENQGKISTALKMLEYL